jgi:hypothetical protein
VGHVACIGEREMCVYSEEFEFDRMEEFLDQLSNSFSEPCVRPVQI